MRSCILGDSMTGANKDLYDLRYFYCDENRTGRSSCGMARQTLLWIYRQHKNWKPDFYGLLTITRESRNVSFRGFLMEVCLQVIADKGLCAIPHAGEGAPGGPLQKELFEDIPNWSNLTDSDGHDCCLYLPTKFNYPNVDAAVLHLECRVAKKAHLYLIQMTLATQHKDSERLFYQTQWGQWTEDLVATRWALKSTFIWIDLKQPEGGCISKEIEGRPDYTRWRVGIMSLDHSFKEVLSCPVLVCSKINIRVTLSVGEECGRIPCNGCVLNAKLWKGLPTLVLVNRAQFHRHTMLSGKRNLSSFMVL